MKRNSLFTKAIALLVCAIMLIGYLPSIALPVAASDDFESDIDVVETTEAPTEAPGAESNPILLLDQENSVVNEGTMYYQAYANGMIMTVSGEGDFSVIVNGVATAAVDGKVEMTVTAASPRDPFTFAITGDGTYEVNFTYPEGSMENPAVAYLGDNIANIEAGDQDGYYMVYTADYTGTLVLEMIADAGWTYTVNNLTTGSYGDSQWSDSDPVVNPCELAVTQNDEIQIIVNTYNPEDEWNAPAGELNVNLSYKPGSCAECAIFLGDLHNEVTNAGTVYYMGYFSGTEMTITGEGDFSVVYNGETLTPYDGVVSTAVSTANPRMPVEFSVIGDGEFTIDFVYPVGTQANPAVAILGDNVANIEAGSQGYYYTYTAAEAGTLQISITADAGWTYVVNNITTGIYGDTQWSDSDPVVNPYELAVAAGDEIQIIVSTYDPAAPWEAPAGEITMNLAYASCEHVWGEWEVTTAPTTTTTGEKTRTCTLCGETETEILSMLPSGDAQLKFKGFLLALESDLTATFTVMKDVLDAYENVRVEYCLGDEITEEGTVVVTDYVQYTDSNNKERCKYAFAGIAPYQANQTIHATIYGTYEGVEYSFSMTHSITKYCTSTLSKTTTSNTLKTLIVDLLNYCTMQQVYLGDTNTPVNSILTEEQAALGSTHIPTMSNDLDQEYVKLEGATAVFKGATLNLLSAVEIVATVDLSQVSDTSSVYLKVDTGFSEISVPFADFVYQSSSGRHKVYFRGIPASAMDSLVYLTVCDANGAISNTLQYSIPTYGNRNYTGSGSSLDNLLVALYRYGEAAKAYFAA